MDTIEELKKDELFMSRLAKMTDPKEVVDIFAEKGIEISEEEASLALTKVEEDSADELTDESLEKVSGGSITLGLMLGFAGLVAVISFARGINASEKKACKP